MSVLTALFLCRVKAVTKLEHQDGCEVRPLESLCSPGGFPGGGRLTAQLQAPFSGHQVMESRLPDLTG